MCCNLQPSFHMYHNGEGDLCNHALATTELLPSYLPVSQEGVCVSCRFFLEMVRHFEEPVRFPTILEESCSFVGWSHRKDVHSLSACGLYDEEGGRLVYRFTRL